MREIRTKEDGTPCWEWRLAWKIEEFFWDFIEALEDYTKALWHLLTNPAMALFLGFMTGLFVISVMGTKWWGW